jgi:hypothetical protein
VPNLKKKSLRKASQLLILILSVSIIACCIAPVSAQSSTTVKVEPSTSSPILGHPFTVTIKILDVQNLYGLEVLLTWDPAVLKATTVDIRVGVESLADGVLHESSSSPPIFLAENNLTQNEGEYQLTVTSMAPASFFSGSGNVVKITFNPIALGSSALNLQSQLYDYPPTDRDPRISLPIDYVVQDSSVTVQASSYTPSGDPTASQTPVTSVPTATSTLPTPTQTSKPLQKENWGWAYVLFVAVLAVLLIAILIFIRNRKKSGAYLNSDG